MKWEEIALQRAVCENTVECTGWLPPGSPNLPHLQEPMRIREWKKRYQLRETTFSHSSEVSASTALLWASCKGGQGRAGHCLSDRGLAVILPPQKNKNKKYPVSSGTYQKLRHLGRIESLSIGSHLPRIVEKPVLTLQATNNGKDLILGSMRGVKTL